MERHEDDPASNSAAMNAVEVSFEQIAVRDHHPIFVDSDPKFLDGSEVTNGQSSMVKIDPGLEESQQKKMFLAADCNADQSEDVAYLKQQLEQNRVALAASEELAVELRKSLLDAEQRAEKLTMDLSEAQKKMDDELTARDKKYTELDNKFVKLQKRAKQRIQEVQKEKEDVEAQLAAASEKTSQALSQCTSLQHELERVRAQAGEALRTLDAERQQLRIANNKQKETMEDLQRKVDMKEKECKEAQQTSFEKEQVVNELTDKLMGVEQRHGAVIAELTLKHQKVMEDLESQLAEAIHERTKSSETITLLQIQVAQKEAHIAELDAASSGEVIRLTATLEAVRGELARVDQEHRKKQETWDATLEAMKLKLEENEKLYLHHQILSAKEKSQMESELQGIRQALNVAEAERDAAREQVVRLEKDFSAYKVRAYSLLQKKEAELSAAKDAELLASQEAALKEAQRVAITATAERERAVKALQDAVVEHGSQLAARSVALLDAEQKIRELAAKLESTKARIVLEQEAYQSRIDEINAEWEEKYNALQLRNATKDQLEKEIVALKESCSRLKEEHEAFQQMTNKMLESKDKEIAHLLHENRGLQQDIDSFKVSREVTSKTQAEVDDISLSSFEVGEQQILVLARQQAQREEELAQCQRHIQALQDEIVELERENRLHAQQEFALKEELRNLERSKKREGVDMTYLKNVILKLLETGEVEALLPVVAMLLQFSPDEMRKCQEVYNLVPETPVAVSDGSRTLLSRFLFSKAGK